MADADVKRMRFCKTCLCETDRQKQGGCKPCATERERKRRVVHRERINAKERERYGADPEKNKSAVRAWQSANPEKVKAANKRWRDSHPDTRQAHGSSRRAKDKAAEGRHSGADIRRLLALQKGQCAVCKTSIKHAKDVDHIIPLALGGSNWPHNLQLLCPKCNRSKGAKHPIDFMQKLGFLL